MNENWDAPVIMKAITIHQPYASLIAVGAKRFETRGWKTSHRGPVAIHAGRKFTPYDEQDFNDIGILLRATDVLFPDTKDGLSYGTLFGLPHGAVIATAELVECWGIQYITPGFETPEPGITFQTEKMANITRPAPDGRGQNGRMVSGDELLFGDWRAGRYAWELANVQLLPVPVPCRGQQGLWNWEVNP